MEHPYKQTAGVVTRQIAGETLLVPISGHLPDMRELYALDSVSSFIWDLLDGTHGADAIVKAVTDEYEVAAEVAAKDVAALLEDLVSHDLVETA